MENHPPHRWSPFLLPFLFLSAFAAALRGLNPSFYLNDSPEMAAAFALGGVAHPPGYPLPGLLGHLLTVLPLGSIAFRANLFSALCASALCVMVFLLLRDRLQVPSLLSFCFSILWMTGTCAYPAALSSKTGLYLMAAVLLLSILWALMDGRMSLAVFFWGLSLAGHWMTMVVFLPGLLLLGAVVRKERGAPAPNGGEIGETPGFERVRFLILPALLLLGLTPYLYLPLRAHLHPPLDWGEPDSLGRFLFNFFRKQYLGPEASGGPQVWFPQWGLFLKAGFSEFGGLFLLALFGAVRMFLEARGRASALLLAWVFPALAIGVYLNLPENQEFLIRDYALATHVFILIFSAWALHSLLRGLEEGRKRILGWTAALAFLALFFVLPGVQRAVRLRQTDYVYAYDYVLNGFRAIPRNGLYFCKGDTVVFPAWYFQWVEGKRRDLAVVGVDGIPMEWVRQRLAKDHPDLKVPFSDQPLGLESIPLLSQWIVAHNPDRELYFSYNKIEDGVLPGTREVLYGLVGKGFAKDVPVTLDEPKALSVWENMRLRHMNDPDFPVDDRTYDFIVRDYGVFRNGLGIFYEDRADEAKAKRKPGAPVQEYLGEQRDYQKSYAQYFWAQQWVPDDPKFTFNRGNALFHLGRYEEAGVWYDKAIALKKDYTEAYFNAAVAALQLNEYQRAGDLLTQALTLKPDYAEARTGLDYLVRNGRYQVKR